MANRREFLQIGALASALSIGSTFKLQGSDAKRGNDVFREPSKDIPVVGEYDVLVCGGGPAGFAAAVSAARTGAKVALVEVQGYLGGVWTAGLMTHFIDAENKAGIMKELLDVQKYAEVIEARWFDVELTKLWLEKFCMQSGVELCYHTRVAGAYKEKGRLSAIITENSTGRQAWKAKIFIDTTGNGDLAVLAGCKYDAGHPQSGLKQPLSLNILVSGINLKDLQEHEMISVPGGSWGKPKENLLAEIRRGGADCSYSKPTFFSIRNDFFSLMSNHQYKVNETNAREITMATIEARAEMHRQVDALRSLGGIWKNIHIVGTADQIGIRESRRIHGLYTISKDDLKNGAQFDDAVCRVMFKTDVHSLDPVKSKEIEAKPFKTLPYDIPLRSLIARDVTGLMMAGRCISGDFYAHSSYRVTGNAVAMGETAGKVAAIAAKTNRLPQDIKP